MSTSLKRNSSIVYVQEKRIKNYNIEELVVSCSVNTIIEIVESFSIEWCNECHGELNDAEDVENALKMLKCPIHRRKMCRDNYIFLKDMIINELCA